MNNSPLEYHDNHFAHTVLDVIQQMLAENRAIMKNNLSRGYPVDYLDGANTALKSLAVELNLATYEQLKD